MKASGKCSFKAIDAFDVADIIALRVTTLQNAGFPMRDWNPKIDGMSVHLWQAMIEEALQKCGAKQFREWTETSAMETTYLMEWK